MLLVVPVLRTLLAVVVIVLSLLLLKVLLLVDFVSMLMLLLPLLLPLDSVDVCGKLIVLQWSGQPSKESYMYLMKVPKY